MPTAFSWGRASATQAKLVRSALSADRDEISDETSDSSRPGRLSSTCFGAVLTLIIPRRVLPLCVVSSSAMGPNSSIVRPVR